MFTVVDRIAELNYLTLANLHNFIIKMTISWSYALNIEKGYNLLNSLAFCFLKYNWSFLDKSSKSAEINVTSPSYWWQNKCSN